MDPLCSVVIVDHNVKNTDQPSESGWTIGFKAVIDPSCTLDPVQAGLCSACPAAAVLAGQCPPGIHTIVTNIVTPGGVVSNTSVAVTLYVGASLFSAEVIVRFEVVSSTEGMNRPAEASARLKQMLVATQVLFKSSTPRRMFALAAQLEYLLLPWCNATSASHVLSSLHYAGA